MNLSNEEKKDVKTIFNIINNEGSIALPPEDDCAKSIERIIEYLNVDDEIINNSLAIIVDVAVISLVSDNRFLNAKERYVRQYNFTYVKSFKKAKLQRQKADQWLSEAEGGSTG